MFNFPLFQYIICSYSNCFFFSFFYCIAYLTEYQGLTLQILKSLLLFLHLCIEALLVKYFCLIFCSMSNYYTFQQTGVHSIVDIALLRSFQIIMKVQIFPSNTKIAFTCIPYDSFIFWKYWKLLLSLLRVITIAQYLPCIHRYF